MLYIWTIQKVCLIERSKNLLKREPKESRGGDNAHTNVRFKKILNGSFYPSWNHWSHSSKICDALSDLIPFVQYKKREKHPWRSVNFCKVAGFTKINTPPWVFFTFFKLYKWYQIAQQTKNMHRSKIIDSPNLQQLKFWFVWSFKVRLYLRLHCRYMNRKKNVEEYKKNSFTALKTSH